MSYSSSHYKPKQRILKYLRTMSAKDKFPSHHRNVCISLTHSPQKHILQLRKTYVDFVFPIFGRPLVMHASGRAIQLSILQSTGCSGFYPVTRRNKVVMIMCVNRKCWKSGLYCDWDRECWQVSKDNGGDDGSSLFTKKRFGRLIRTLRTH